MREGADRARDGAGGDLLARRFEAALGAVEFRIGEGEFEPERGGLGMNAVGAADGRRELEFAGAALQRGVERFNIPDEKVGGANELHVETGVEHVGGRHALVHEARFRSDDFRKMRKESDDVVLGLALDFLDARGVELGVLALGPDFRRRVLGNDPELGHGVGGMRLDLEPDAKTCLWRPDRRHFRSGVTRDHLCLCEPTTWQRAFALSDAVLPSNRRYLGAADMSSAMRASNQATSRFQPALSGNSSAMRSTTALPRRSASSACSVSPALPSAAASLPYEMATSRCHVALLGSTSAARWMIVRALR